MKKFSFVRKTLLSTEINVNFTPLNKFGGVFFLSMDYVDDASLEFDTML